VKTLALAPARRARGTVRLPGSKSISNRALLLAALAKGETVLRGALDADDTQVMRAALGRLGVRISEGAPGELRVAGVGAGAGGLFPIGNSELFLGNAGTAFRPLTAVLALSRGEYLLAGTARMHERPIGDLVDALRAIGARIEYAGAAGFPPLRIQPGKIRLDAPVRVHGDVSSQFLSALLMALPPAGGGTIEVEGELISKPYVEITLGMMQRFGVAVARSGWREFRVPAGPYRSPGELRVEGDASSASYFLAAGAIAGGPVRVEGVGRASVQGDVRFCEVLEKMGAEVTMGEDWIAAGRDASAGAKLRAFDLDLNHIPDAAMTAAVMALFADGPCTLRNIASWRVKETDRIAAMATELRKLGATVEAGSDWLRVVASESRILNPGVAINTYDDHRMAMCFSLASLGGVAVTINDPDCVAKTFPEYFQAFASIVR
jgi:3-phosphoshikimate 1-carboxyvinyltransferase